MNLPSVVKAVRKRNGLSQAKLARVLGVARPTVSGWESGEHGIRPSHAKKLARFAGLKFRGAELVS